MANSKYKFLVYNNHCWEQHNCYQPGKVNFFCFDTEVAAFKPSGPPNWRDSITMPQFPKGQDHLIDFFDVLSFMEYGPYSLQIFIFVSRIILDTNLYLYLHVANCNYDCESSLELVRPAPYEYDYFIPSHVIETPDQSVSSVPWVIQFISTLALIFIGIPFIFLLLISLPIFEFFGFSSSVSFGRGFIY